VYSKGKTELGKWLTNFAHTPIDTVDGHFESIEAYWYWLGTTHPDKDTLRPLYGFRAKELGRQLKADDWQDSDDFKDKIRAAIAIKLKRNPRMMDLLFNNSLPITHYYVYGENSLNPKVIEPESGRWVIEYVATFFDIPQKTQNADK
jgi:hypothetical protein